MEVTARQDYETEQKNNQLNVRKLVLQALAQVNNGSIKNFDEVCDRLEKKFKNV